MGVEVNLKTEVLILISSLGGSWGVKHAGCPPINPISWMSSAKLSPCAPPPPPILSPSAAGVGRRHCRAFALTKCFHILEYPLARAVD